MKQVDINMGCVDCSDTTGLSCPGCPGLGAIGNSVPTFGGVVSIAVILTVLMLAGVRK